MNGRERFNNTLHFKSTDRPPLFEDGIRDEVLRRWRTQGMSKADKLDRLFTFDYREEIEPNLEPTPYPTHWPKSIDGLKNLSTRLDPDDFSRFPDRWNEKIVEWKTRNYPLILRVHRGYFLTMGVHGWNRFTDAIEVLVDNPNLVESWMDINSTFICRLIGHILSNVQVDAALFSEPIGGNHGPLISPRMYSTFPLKSYQPILEVLHSFGVSTIIYRTYANTRVLLPSVVNAGFNCLWACESHPQAMDYREIRKEFGKNLCLIGGIDSDSLRQDQEEIYRSVTELVPPLLKEGGFIPLADGRVREDVPFQNYIYYRKLLENITGTRNSSNGSLI